MYRIEIEENGSKLNLSYDSFNVAKTGIKAISKDLILHSEYYLEQRISARMYGEADKLYHYITAHYPDVSLPSFE